MENVLVILLITAIALIIVAVVLYQRIYKITRNGIYVENGKEKINNLYKKFSQLNIDFMKLEYNTKERLSDMHESIVGIINNIANHSKCVNKVTEEQIARLDKLEADINAAIAALSEEDFGIEAETINPKKEK